MNPKTELLRGLWVVSASGKQPPGAKRYILQRAGAGRAAQLSAQDF